ncbi:MAG: hypothetical protein WC058_14180 [Phycisphaeraceae bacterium]
MSRPTITGLELSFHKPTKRWCKTIQGKRHYFGYGKGASDRASYRTALLKYRDFVDREYQEELIAAATQKTTRRLLRYQARQARQWMAQAELGMLHGIGSSRLSAAQLAQLDAAGQLPAASDEQFMRLMQQTRINHLNSTPAGPARDALLQGRSPSEYVGGLPPRR